MFCAFVEIGKTEFKYAFRREDKPEIGSKLFAYCLYEFWVNRYPDEQSIPLHMLANGHGSPDQVFKIPEMDIRNRLLGIHNSSSGFFEFEESATIPRIVQKKRPADEVFPLAMVYQEME